MKRFVFSTMTILSLLVFANGTVDAQEKGEKKGVKRQRGGQFRKGGRKGRRGKLPVDKLKVGDVAPDFTLKSVDGKETVKLSSFKGKKPVLLVFGSYT